jgi:large subunit ribosomal protein L25
MELSVQKRDVLGKKVSAMRAEGVIPAELYGHGLENLHLGVQAKEFKKALDAAGESSVVTLNVGDQKLPVLIYDVQYHPVTGEVTHVDFYQVRMDEKITAPIEVEFVGDAPAVKAVNGILVKAMQEIEVEALPGDLPSGIKVDLSVLADIGNSIYVKDLKFGKGVRVLVSPDTVVATITAPMAEEEVVVEAPVDLSAIKTEGEEKKAERDAEKAAKETEEKK